MATEAEITSEPSAAGLSEPLAGHGGSGGLPQEVRTILQAREAVDSNPRAFRQPQKSFLGFQVDQGVHTLIENLWLMGIPTDSSFAGYGELCHPTLYSREYFTEISFLRVADAVGFYSLLTQSFGAGTVFGPEGFELTAMDGEFEDLLEDGEEPGLDFYRAANARARGQIRFHPSFVEPLTDLLDGLTNTQDLDAKRALLEVAEDLDEAYEVLEVNADIRRLAEQGVSPSEAR